MSRSPGPIQILWIGTVQQPQPQLSSESPFREQVIYSSGLPFFIHSSMYLSMWTTDETSTSQLCLYEGSQTPDPDQIVFERRNGVLHAIYPAGHTIPTPTPTRRADNVSYATIVSVIEELEVEIEIPSLDFFNEPMVDSAPELFTPGLQTSVSFGHAHPCPTFNYALQTSLIHSFPFEGVSAMNTF